MARRPRMHYTESQKALMWERWRQGESLQAIAQLFGRNHSSVMRILAEIGEYVRRSGARYTSKSSVLIASRVVHRDFSR